jgi:hypothetical protein
MKVKTILNKILYRITYHPIYVQYTFSQVLQLMCCFVAGIMLVEIVWLVLGVMWLICHYHDCPVEGAKEAILGKEQCYIFNV